MAQEGRVWPAYAFALLMTMVFAYFVSDIVRVFNSVRNGVGQIEFDTGVGGFALCGIAPVFALGELCLRRGWVTPQLLRAWGNQVIVVLFASLAAIGYFSSDAAYRHLIAAGYTECKDPREVSRVAPGRNLIFLKGSCSALPIDPLE